MLNFYNAATTSKKILYDAIIVGAGISGMGAALKLTERGLNVLILEARNRVGGRIHSIDLGDTTVDLGANWRHAEQNNPLNSFFNNKKYSLSLHPDNTEEKLINNTLQFTNENGVLYSQDEVLGTLIGQYVAMLEHCGAFAEDDDTYFGNTQSIADLITLYCDKTNNGKIKNDLLFTAALCNCSDYANDLADLPFSSIQAPDGTCPFIQLSNKSPTPSLYADIVLERKDHLVFGGYSNIIDGIVDHITQNCKGKLTIEKNSEVTQINCLDQNQVSIKTKNTVNREESVYHSKYGVIVTLPIGVMQDIVNGKPDFFVPDLSNNKKQAILRARQGTANKIIIQFKDPIMPNVASFFASQNNQDAAICPTQWINFAYYDPNNKYNDNTTIMGLCYGQRGNFADKNDTDILNEAVTELATFLDKPEQEVRDNITFSHITHWENDPYAKGAWATCSIHESPTDRVAIQETVGNKIYFAGDHLSAHGASTHGAFISGQDAATNLCNSHLTPQQNNRKLSF